MNRAYSRLVCASILTLACGSAWATPPETKAVPTVAEGKTLTVESLLEMLKNQGYAPKEEKVGTSQIYWVTVQRAGLSYNISFQISPNQEKIWAIVPLSDIAEPDKAAGGRLLKLLELNDTIGPCYFRFNRASKRLFLSRAMDNRAVTPANFRDNLERLLDRLVETKDAWQVANWSEPTAATKTK